MSFIGSTNGSVTIPANTCWSNSSLIAANCCAIGSGNFTKDSLFCPWWDKGPKTYDEFSSTFYGCASGIQQVSFSGPNETLFFAQFGCQGGAGRRFGGMGTVLGGAVGALMLAVYFVS